MVDSEGNQRYKNLSLLCHCILTLPHGNAEPGRGFSINKAILAVHGFSVKEDTLEALRLVKDFLILDGGGDEVEVTKELRKSCEASHAHDKSVILASKRKLKKRKQSERRLKKN